MKLPVYLIQQALLFEGIEAEHIEPMLCCLGASVRKFGKDSFVFRAGDAIDSVGVVLDGSVHLLQEDAEGNRNIVAAVGPGESFAEGYACLKDAPLGVSVQAETDSSILLMNVQRILSTCTSACAFHARLIRNLVTVLAAKNRLMNEKLACLTRRTTREKVLSYLRAQSLRAKSSAFDIPFDRQGLADYLSVDRSALSAALGKLKAEKLLDFRKNHFSLGRTVDNVDVVDRRDK